MEGYRIRRNGSLIATITTGTSYSDTTANPATAYSYTVDAYDVGLNYSPQSAPAAATTPPDTAAPTAPSNLTAAAWRGRVRLTWTASTDNVGVDRYRIFRDGLEIGTSPPFYTDSTVEPLTPYSYYVRAYDVSNNPSPASNTIDVTTPALPSVMTFGPAADASLRADLPGNNFGASWGPCPVEDLLIKFTVNGVAGRQVESAKLRLYCTDAGGSGGVFKRVANNSWVENTVNWTTAPPAATIATLGATTAGTWYEVDVTSLVTGDGTFSFRSRARRRTGRTISRRKAPSASGRNWWSRRETRPATCSLRPPGERGDGTCAEPRRPGWTASTDNVGVTGYRIYRNGVQIGSSGTSSYSDPDAQPSTSYSYHVVAEDAAGNSSAPRTPRT